MSQQLYFAYGSNLNQKDFNDWCNQRGIPEGLLRFHSNANLPDFDLAFSYRSKTIRHSDGRDGDGSFFRITVDSDALRALAYGVVESAGQS